MQSFEKWSTFLKKIVIDMPFLVNYTVYRQNFSGDQAINMLFVNAQRLDKSDPSNSIYLDQIDCLWHVLTYRISNVFVLKNIGIEKTFQMGEQNFTFSERNSSNH